MVPLVTGDSVVTIVEVNRDDKGWKVIGLAGKDIADDLSAVLRVAGNTPEAAVTLYDVPNLQTKCRRQEECDGNVFHELRRSVRHQKACQRCRAHPALKAGAIEFQRKYGDALKNQRLVR